MSQSRQAEPGSDIGLILAVLRTVRRYTQAQLADRAGIKRGLVSNYERGETSPDLCTLERLLGALDFGFSAIDRTRDFLRSVLPGEILFAGRAESAEGTRRPAAEIISLAVEAMGKITEQALRTLWEGEDSQAEAQRTQEASTAASQPSSADRAEAMALWERLKRHSLKGQQALVAEASEFKNWALCELLCRESEKAAATSADLAIAFAGLAVKAAEGLAEPAAQQGRVAAYAYAHLGNALRVKGDLPASRTAFRKFDSLWRDSARLPNLLAEARALDMKASLLRAERQLPEALAALDQAFVADRDRTLRPCLLINKAKVLEESAKLDQAIDLLREAEPLIQDDPRLLLCARHNLLDNLTKAGRFAEALPLLPGVKVLSRKLGNELDLVRLQWVEGLIARGLGESKRAIELLSKVRGEFASRTMPFDTVLVTLELASMHLEAGAVDHVMTLARHMVKTFQALSVHREALAALILFKQAAEQGSVTEELLGRLMRFMREAAHEPGLRFV